MLKVDLHSHLIPGVDDGVKTVDETVRILRILASHGYEKVITTPHIYPEVYPNNEAFLIDQFQQLQSHVQEAGIKIAFELGAEYYMHEELLQKIRNKQDLLSFSSEKFLLIETSFQDRPMIWDELFFELQVQGYKPILAHPERYTYVSEDVSLVEKWRSQGIRMQMNFSSLLGKYGKAVQRTAKELIKRNQIDFMASDLHQETQLELISQIQKNKLFRQLLGLVQNNQLL